MRASITDRRVDLNRELCLGMCAALLARWVGPHGSHGDRESLQMFFLKSLLSQTLSRVMFLSHMCNGH